MPSIEINTKNAKSVFLRSHPLEIMKRGEFQNVPLLIGGLTTEGYMTGSGKVTNSHLCFQIHYFPS